MSTERLSPQGEAALDAARADLRIFPVVPGEKRPAVKDWPNAATTDEAQIREWWTENPAYNLAAALSPGSSVTVLDPDQHPGQPDGIAAVRAIEEGYGISILDQPHVKTPRGEGRHVYGLPPDDLDGTALGDPAPAVEVFGRGTKYAMHYVILPPSTTQDGTYGLVGADSISDLVEQARPFPAQLWNGAAADATTPPAPTTTTDAARRDLARAAATLRDLGVPAATERGRWINVLAALHCLEERHGSRVAREALALTNAWSKQGGDAYRGLEDVTRTWDSFNGKPDKLATLRTLEGYARKAQEAGEPGWVGMPDEWCRLAEGAPRLPGLELLENPPKPAPMEWGIRPLVIRGGLTFLHAPPKSSKSNLVLYLLCEWLRGRDPIPSAFEAATPIRRALLLTEMGDDVAHGFADLYDPGRELRDSGRLVIAPKDFKAKLTTTDKLREYLTTAVEELGFDVIAVDTFLAFSAWTVGSSISEAADTAPLVAALRAVPASVFCTHHDRKNADGKVSHVNMLGTTALRAASDSNVGVILEDEETTLLRVEVEARDPAHVRYLAQRAEAAAGGEEPPVAPALTTRRWFLRLGYEDAGGRVVYRLAEPHLVPEGGGGGAPKYERPDVIAAVNRALVGMTRDAAAAGNPRVFGPPKVKPRADSEYAAKGGTGTVGRETVGAVLGALPGVIHVPQGDYPGNKKAGGYGLEMYLPKPLGWGHEPPEEDEGGPS